MREPFDLEAVYDEQIAPLMARIIEVCQANNIPMLASFAYSYDGSNDYGVATTFLPAEGRTPPNLRTALDAVYPRLPTLAIRVTTGAGEA
jgi:hypothetical protein